MIWARRLLALASMFAAAFAAPVTAQSYDGSIGYGGGAIWFSDFNSGGNGEQLVLDPGWVAAGHIEHWVDGGYFGGRINGAFTSRPMATQNDVRNIRTWIVGGDLMLRLPSSGFSPFIAAGAGMVNYGLGTGPVVVMPQEDARYPGNTDRRFSVSGGVGFDILAGLNLFNTPTGIRVEAIDHIVLDSPFESLAGGDFDPVHNLRVTIGLLGLVELLQ